VIILISTFIAIFLVLQKNCFPLYLVSYFTHFNYETFDSLRQPMAIYYCPAFISFSATLIEFSGLIGCGLEHGLNSICLIEEHARYSYLILDLHVLTFSFCFPLAAYHFLAQQCDINLLKFD